MTSRLYISSIVVLLASIVSVYYFTTMRDGYNGIVTEAPGSTTSKPVKIKYTAVPDFFRQDDPDTESRGYDYTIENFGLIDRSYETDQGSDPDKSKTQWERFENFVRVLNQQNPQNISYKVLYIGRHGEGYHNVAIREYGDQEWDDYWSKQGGDSNKNWTDSVLTDAGEQQAKINHDFFAKLLATEKAPAPQSYYTSPLARCLQTCQITFSDLELPKSRPFRPLVKELLRETIGEHTCDKRSSRTWIAAHFPNFTIEPSLTEADELWTPHAMESRPDRVARLHRLLDDIFAHDSHTWLSFTSHSGAIMSLLQAVGHRPFPLGTAGMIPILVRAERVDGGSLPKES